MEMAAIPWGKGMWAQIWAHIGKGINFNSANPRQNKEWADKADLIEYLYTDEAEHQEEIS